MRALLVLLLAVPLPGLAAAEPFACTPEGEVCAGETTSGAAGCPTEDSSWTAWTGAAVYTDDASATARGSRSCWREDGPTATARDVTLLANSAAGGAWLFWWSGSSGSSIQAGLFVAAATVATYWVNGAACESGITLTTVEPSLDQALPLGCPQGAPPSNPEVAWGELVP